MTAALDAIRALAEAATPGPWQVQHGQSDDISSAVSHHKPICRGHDYDDYGNVDDADAAYIAAVDPQTVLALLAALDRQNENVRLRKRLDRAEAALRDILIWAEDAPFLDRVADHVSKVARAALRAYEDADKVADG